MRKKYEAPQVERVDIILISSLLSNSPEWNGQFDNPMWYTDDEAEWEIP